MGLILSLEFLTAFAGGAASGVWVHKNVHVSEEAQAQARALLSQGRARLPGAVAAVTHLALIGTERLRQAPALPAAQGRIESEFRAEPVTEGEIAELTGEELGAELGELFASAGAVGSAPLAGSSAAQQLAIASPGFEKDLVSRFDGSRTGTTEDMRETAPAAAAILSRRQTSKGSKAS
jgi:hypothetical protein